jgi:hypothetical protein
MKSKSGPDSAKWKRVFFKRVYVWVLFDKEGWWVTTLKGHRHNILIGWHFERREKITIHSITVFGLNIKLSYLRKCS